MTTLDEARELLAARRRVGFEPPPTATPAAVARIPLARVENIVARAVAKANEQFVARAGSTAPRAPWTGPETSSDDLRKATVVDDAAYEPSSAVDDVRKLHAGGGAAHRTTPALATGALLDSAARVDHLAALQKATPGYVSAAAVAETEQRAAGVAALAEARRVPMMHKADGSMMTPPTAEERAAAVNDPAWSERLRDEAVAAEIRRVRPRRLG